MLCSYGSSRFSDVNLKARMPWTGSAGHVSVSLQLVNSASQEHELKGATGNFSQTKALEIYSDQPDRKRPTGPLKICLGPARLHSKSSLRAFAAK